jgi:hypothetical protein
MFKGNAKSCKEPGLHIKIWLDQFENYLSRESLQYNDEQKISLSKTFICQTDGDAHLLINTLPGFQKVKNWNIFKSHMVSIFSSEQETQLLKHVEEILDCEWQRDKSLAQYASAIAQETEKFSFAYNNLISELPVYNTLIGLGIDLGEEIVKILTYHKIRQSCQPKYQKIIDETLDIAADPITMIGKLSLKDSALKNGTCLSNKGPKENRAIINQTKNVRLTTGSEINTPKPQERPKNAQKQPQPFRASQRQTQLTPTPQRVPPLKREGFDPRLRCYNCERIGHHTNECPWQPYCSLCRQKHKRGTTSYCKSTEWDWQTNPTYSWDLPKKYEQAGGRAPQPRQFNGLPARRGGRPAANSRPVQQADDAPYDTRGYSEEELAHSNLDQNFL